MVKKILFISLILNFFFCSNQFNFNKNFKSSKGILDLTSIDFKKEYVELKGEWKLKNGIDFSKTGFANVPDFWDNSNIEGFKDSAFGVAVYSLEVVGLKARNYSSKFQEIQNAFFW